MTEVTPLAESLADEFLVRNYEWSGPDGKIIPDAETVQRMLDRLLTALYSGKTASGEDVGQIEMGRLLVRRDDDLPDTMNIYLWMGEVKHEGS